VVEEEEEGMQEDDEAYNAAPDEDDLSVMTYRQMQKECKKLGLAAAGSTDVLRKRIRSFRHDSATDDIEEEVEVSNDIVVEEEEEGMQEDDEAYNAAPDEDDLSVMTYRQMQKECKKLGLAAAGSTVVLRKRIRSFRQNFTNDNQSNAKAPPVDNQASAYSESAKARKSATISKSAQPNTPHSKNSSLLNSVLQPIKEFFSPKAKDPEVIDLLDDDSRDDADE